MEISKAGQTIGNACGGLMYDHLSICKLSQDQKSLLTLAGCSSNDKIERKIVIKLIVLAS